MGYWTSPYRKGHRSRFDNQTFKLHLDADPDGRWEEKSDDRIYYDRLAAFKAKRAWAINHPYKGNAYAAMTDAVQIVAIEG